MYSDKAVTVETMLNSYLSTCSRSEALEVAQVLKKIASSIENGKNSKNGKRRYTRITNEVLGRIKDYIVKNPDAPNWLIEDECGIGTNSIATLDREVLEGITLSEYVNICRVDPDLLEKRKSGKI